MGAGRPSLYKPEYNNIAAKMCELGATDAEMASAFSVSVQTLNTWKIQHPEFLASIKENKEIADERVKRSLYQRAVGYSCDEVDIKVINGEIVQTPILKHYPPETTAGIFWLKNRDKENWRDKQEVDHSSSDGSMTPQVVQYQLPSNGRD